MLTFLKRNKPFIKLVDIYIYNKQIMIMVTQENVDFIKNKYEGKYDTSKVEVSEENDFVILICKKHGEFKISLKSALRNDRGTCKKCGLEKRKEFYKNNYCGMTTEEFIQKANKTHNNKYDYSKVDMEHRREDGRVCIICHELDENGVEHGEFWQKPNSHIFKDGCPKCGSNKKTTKKFIAEAKQVHGDRFSYDKTVYEGIFTPVIVTCNKCHHDFPVTPHNHLKGRGCPICSKTHGTLFEQFFEIANAVHNGKYIYHPEEWPNKAHDTKIRITCPKHGDFWQRPAHHMEGIGCPVCNNSKLENTIFTFLREKNIAFEIQKQFDWLGAKKLDFFIPSKNIAIECQGIQHFQPIDYFGGEKAYLGIIERDKIKRRLCEEHDIKILYYSNLKITYPYEVFEDTNTLFEIINADSN